MAESAASADCFHSDYRDIHPGLYILKTKKTGAKDVQVLFVPVVVALSPPWLRRDGLGHD
jgi:hypothetical protein